MDVPERGHESIRRVRQLMRSSLSQEQFQQLQLRQIEMLNVTFQNALLVVINSINEHFIVFLMYPTLDRILIYRFPYTDLADLYGNGL